MRSNVIVLLFLYISGLAFAALEKKADPPDGCHADNCLRAIRAASQAAQATLDCRSFLLASVFPPLITVTVTSTVISTVKIGGKARHAIATTLLDLVIPSYASACTDAAEFSSACYCIGVTGATTTLAGIRTTVTIIATSTKTATPTCTANILSDFSNCGDCGIICPSGSICENGSCTSTSCNGETCTGGFTNCNTNNLNCFCFTNAKGTGFCGQNALCSDLTPCTTDVDCDGLGSSGNICALNTCCADTGVCLSGQCSNPSTKFMRMAREVKRNHLGLGTAAF